MLKLVLTMALLALTQVPAEARSRSGGGSGCCVMVRGYVRSNGSYVQPYLRSPPGHGWAAGSTPRSGFTGTGVLSPTGTPTSFAAGRNGALSVTAPEFEEPVEIAYKPVFKANDHCTGHKLYGEKTGAAVCIIGGQDDIDSR